MATLAERLKQPDVASLEDGAAADVLNTPDPANGTTWREHVPVKEAAGVYRATVSPTTTNPADPITSMIALEDAAATPGHPVRNTARAALELLRRETAEIDASNDVERTIVQGMVTALAAGGVISTATRDILLGLLVRPMSWAEANGYPNGITADDVFVARGRPRTIQQG